MKRMLAIITLILCLCLTACAPTAPAEQILWHMDTAITVRLYGDAAQTKAALAACNDTFAKTDALLSATRKDSPISLFNASSDGSDVALPEQVRALIDRALDISRITDGAFDITCAPLSALWQNCEQSNTPPTAEQLQAALDLVGSEHLSPGTTALQKDNSGVHIDLGGIGKGYAMDRALQVLQQYSDITGGIISMGSNVAVVGDKPDGSPWNIALRDPNDATAAVGYLHLTEGQILSVSGDYERYFTIDGQHYSHILDPKTGYPPTGGLRSVAVLCADGATADALSTALMVMGEDAARALYENGTLDFEAVFVYDDRVSTTDGIELH